MDHPKSDSINVNAPADDGWTPIHFLIHNFRFYRNRLEGLEAIIDTLSKRKIDFNTTDIDGKTPLHVLIKDLCCQNSSTLANVLRIILKHPSSKDINLNIADKFGRTVLHNLCYDGSEEAVAMLLENPVSSTIDYKRRDKLGHTALQVALLKDHHGIVELISKNLPNKRRRAC